MRPIHKVCGGGGGGKRGKGRLGKNFGVIFGKVSKDI